MKITNKFSLPEALVRAVENDEYDGGVCDISVTRLISPPRMVALNAKHAQDLEEDVSDRIWSLLGQVMHKILERADIKNALTEERLYMDVEGWRLSGQLDRMILMGDGTLQDWKMVFARSLAYGIKDEWVFQLNCLAELLRQHSFEVQKLEIVAIVRDWNRSESRKTPDYPKAAAVVVPIPLWDSETAMSYIKNRIKLHQAARINLPECTLEERWGRPDKYAVMRPGGKRAIRLFDAKDEATQYLEGIVKPGEKLFVEYRKGENIRCESYCSAAPFCDQFKALKEQGNA